MKKFTYMVLGLIGIMGALLVGVANAATISYSLSGHEGTYYANDLELYFLKNAETVSHYTIMDRNLGASKVYNQDWNNQNTESYGYVYQRGNNYGFPSTSKSFGEQPTTGVQVPKSVRSGFSPSGYWSDVRYRGENSWMGSGSMYDNIWGGAGDTVEKNGDGSYVNRQGPCPNGYYIPSVRDWFLIKKDWSAYANSNRLTGFSYDLLLPPAGMRKNESSVAKVSNFGLVGTYRTSSPRRENSDNGSAYVLEFRTDVDSSDRSITDPIRSRSLGVSLRCFKNDFQSGGNLEFHLNGGEKGVVAVNSGKFTSISNPSRNNSIFEGWYTTSDFQTGTKVWVGSGTEGVRDLYAKWGCKSDRGYVLSGNDCVGGTIVTFDTYGGASQSWSITVPYGTVLDLSGEVAILPDGTTIEITGEAIAYSGQTFAGWGTGYGNYRTVKTLVIGEENITLHARFRNNLQITFNATENGGETNTGSISVPYGTLIDLSKYTATKGSGGVRTFLGRNTYSGATGGLSNLYKAENEDWDYITLYAIFRKDKFNVIFNTNGHGDTPSTQTINRGDKIINPGNLTAPGYNFEGWSDNEYLTTNFNFGITPTDDVTLYAKWRVPGAECYEGFEYDDDLGMCIKKNEWVVRVGLGGGIILSSGYSDFLEDLVTLLITGDYKSKMGNFDIAKNYYGIILIKDEDNNDISNVNQDGPLSTEGQIVEVFEKHGNEKDLLFTMNTKASCRGDGPNCKFYNQNIEVAEGIPEWHNLKLVVPGYLKQQFGSLTGIIRADNIRLIFDPRVVVTFDSNGHGVSPERQFLNKGSRIINPGSLSAVGYKFLGWSDDEYLTSIFDFNTVVNGDIKLYAKWKPIGDTYNCPEGQEYDNSVGVCKRPTDWVIRIGYNGDVEFSSGYSSFLDETLLKEINSSEMDETEIEAFKKAFGILFAVLETFDGTDKIVIDEAGIVMDGNLWLLNYYNKDGKLLFTVVVDMTGTDLSQGNIHTRSMYVNVANNISSSDNLKLVPSSTGKNQYLETYPPIAQLENLWIIFSDRMEPSVVDNGGNNYSGGGSSNKTDTNNDSTLPVDNQDNNTDPSNNPSEGQTYTDEFQQAYEFAYENGITTMDTIEKADIEGPLTRIAMAKMLSNYAINVLGKKPANIVVPNFTDVNSGLDEEYDFGVTLGYQLGIMGINMPNNKFRPFDYVTRAEFATALSRMLFSTPDGDPYYTTHLAKLKAEGIITNDDPSLKELRGYVMIMLMRSAKD